MEKYITKDGSTTFYNNEVLDHYHTKAGARQEARRCASGPHRGSAGVQGPTEAHRFWQRGLGARATLGLYPG